MHFILAPADSNTAAAVLGGCSVLQQSAYE